MIKILIRSFLTISIILFSFKLYSQILTEKEFEQRLNFERGNYPIQNYNQDFLNRPGYVWGILKSKKDNLIYMAANRGVIEYDGVNIRRLPVKEDTTYSGVFGGPFARSLVEMEDGTIYSTGVNRFGRLVDNEYGFKEYEYLLHKLPDSIDYRRQGNIWGAFEHNNKVIFYTPNFIFSWDGEKFDRIWKMSDYAGARNSKGKIHGFAKTGNIPYMRRWGYGMYKLVDDEFQFIEGTEIFADNRIELFYENSNKDLLLFSRQLGAYILDKDGKLSKSDNEILNKWLIKNAVYVHDDLRSFKDGTFPVHSRGGILILDDDLNILNSIDEDDGLETSTTNITFIDENDNLLIGTTNGFSKISFNNSLTEYDSKYGIGGYVWAPIKRLDGKLYFGSTKDLYSLSPSYDPMKNNKIDIVGFNDMMGEYHKFDNSIIGVHNYGLSEYNGNNVIMISNDYDIAMSSQSKLNKKLLLTAHNIDGLKIMRRNRDGKFRIIKTFQPNNKLSVRGFKELKPGKLILNTGPGGTFFASYDYNGNFSFSKADHPLKDSIQSNLVDSLKNDLSLLPDSSFNWANSNIGYIAFSDSASVHKIDIDNQKLLRTGINMAEIVNAGLFNPSYNEDSRHNWYLTRSGVYEVKINEDSYDIIKIHNWGEIDYNELTGRVFVEGVGENQTLWLGSNDAKLIRWLPYKSSGSEVNSIKPIMRGFYVNNNLQSLDTLNLKYDSSRSIKFEYSYPVYNKEENNEFRVFLKGQDSDTSDWSKTSFREYTNLPENDYELYIQARDTNGNESEFVSFSFTILPPWYRTYAAYASYLILLAFGFRAFGKYQAKKSLEQADNERRAGELEEAKKIQQSMLPKVFPSSKLFDVSAGLVTSTEIGGDYYDFFEKKDTLYAVCGDATGHGTASGMMVSIIKSGLNGLPALSTNKVLYELNNIVKKIDLGTLKMSLNICEVTKNSITLSSAAMPPMYLYNSKSKKTEEILIRGLPLGGLKNETFDIEKRKFSKGDVLVLLSDGLPEAENDAGELYDYERVVKLINENATKSAEELKNKLIGEVDIWLKGGIPDDDVTIVVIKKV